MALTSPGPPVTSPGPEADVEALRGALRAGLAESRARTLALADLPDAEQTRQISPIMSPIVWDVAHIANYEELWLVRAVARRESSDPDRDHLYDAFEHPRAERPSLPLLSPSEARAYAAQVREEALSLLDDTDLSPAAPDPLLRDGFVYGMVLQHEHMHDETLLATLHLRGEDADPPPGATSPAPAASPPVLDDVAIPGGAVEIGTSDDPWALDNERPLHVVEVAPFRLDRHPVTCGQHLEFVEAGGYDDAGPWTDEGWAWRQQERLTAPAGWRRTDDGWQVLRFGTWRPLDLHEPVQHVCAHEADAYARWAGRRLPTELEWETAATVGADGSKRRYPWGDDAPTPAHANLGQRHDGPAPAGSFPDGANPWGVQGLVGDVWEWTASTFEAWPGFRSFPYREYSEVFFGEGYRVLRGGSWATHPVAVRGTFRNWDHAIRRQIFCGFRTAVDP